MPRRIADPLLAAPALGVALFQIACGPPPPRYGPLPATLHQATVVPPLPTDPSDPLSRIMWVLNYDLREFDSTWEWLHDSATPSPERTRAIGIACLIGVFELGRGDLVEEGRRSLDEAFLSFPDDARLPLWRTVIEYVGLVLSGDRSGLPAAYDAIRAATHDYPEFTLFGLTLTVAGDPDASPELIEEALTAYERVFEGADELQFRTDPLSRERAPRAVGDWSHAPFNIPGTNALVGDLAVRAGDFELARRSYYTALRSNLAYRWLWRTEVARRLEDVEALAARLAARPALDHMLGAGYAGALGNETNRADPWLSGRIGNGSCTLCHTALTTYDAGEEAATVGWIHFRHRRPAGVETPLPLFLALPSTADDARPESFAIGAIDLDGVGPYLASAEFQEGWIAAPPGTWFLAGRINRGGVPVQETYTAKEFGMPRFIEVRAGEVADITETVMEWGPPR